MDKKSLWDKIQIIFTVLTPLILGIGGFYINMGQKQISENISHLQNTVATVDAMKPYFDMLVGEEAAKAKMAAYALYMLNREEPELLVSIIVAANRKDLNDVLKDLGSRDPKILSLVSKAIISKEGVVSSARVKSNIEMNAQNIIESISTQTTGWSFIGTFKDSSWINKTIAIGSQLPVVNKVYKVIDDVYLRDSKPHLPDYQLGEVLGVIKAGEVIRIDELDPNVGNNRVWAKVAVVFR